MDGRGERRAGSRRVQRSRSRALYSTFPFPRLSSFVLHAYFFLIPGGARRATPAVTPCPKRSPPWPHLSRERARRKTLQTPSPHGGSGPWARHERRLREAMGWDETNRPCGEPNLGTTTKPSNNPKTKWTQARGRRAKRGETEGIEAEASGGNGDGQCSPQPQQQQQSGDGRCEQAVQPRENCTTGITTAPKPRNVHRCWYRVEMGSTLRPHHTERVTNPTPVHQRLRLPELRNVCWEIGSIRLFARARQKQPGMVSARFKTWHDTTRGRTLPHNFKTEHSLGFLCSRDQTGSNP